MSDWDSLFEIASGNEVIANNGPNTIDQRQHKRQQDIESNPSVSTKKRKSSNENTSTSTSTKKKINVIPSSKKEEHDMRMIIPTVDCRWGGDPRCKCQSCRATPYISILSQVQLGSSLPHISKKNPLYCHQWIDKKKSETKANAKSYKRICKNCQQSPLMHEIHIHPDHKHSSQKMKTSDKRCEKELIYLFVHTRNIRASISCLHNHHDNEDVIEDYKKVMTKLSKLLNLSTHSIQSILQSMLERFSSKSSSFSQKNEISLLLEKSSHLQKTIHALETFLLQPQNQNLQPQNKKYDYSIQQSKVQTLIAVDAFYYRLYYLTLHGFFPTNFEFPNPCLYFGTQGVTWDVSLGDQLWKDFSKDWIHKSKLPNTNDSNETYKKVQTWVHDRFGIQLFTSQDDNESSFPTFSFPSQKMDPLSFMHRNRLLETILLFWSQFRFQSHSNVCQDMKQALHEHFKVIYQARTNIDMINNKNKKLINDIQEKELLQHETPAPLMLKEWRDSCRDHLCSLYAYATIAFQSPSTTQLLKQIQRYNIRTVIEMGCGTGYIAKSMQTAGIDVVPYDIAPPPPPLSSMKTPTITAGNFNEYHGMTPPFCTIQAGDSHHLKHLFSNNSFHKTLIENTALMLCYPPPSPSTMAMECLHSFMSIGGTFLIYIGEFYGLTATPGFEHKLNAGFDCIHRIPCLSWGTDASELSIWKRKSKPNKTITPVKCSASASTSSLPIRSPSSIILPCCHCGIKSAIKRCIKARPLVYCSQKCYHQHTLVRKVHFDLQMIPSTHTISSPRDNEGDEINDFEIETEFIELPLLNSISRRIGMPTLSSSGKCSRLKKNTKKKEKKSNV